MEVYRFRVQRKWYAYALRGDAENARQYFLNTGYPTSLVGEIEKSEEQDFQLKMNSTTYPTFTGRT